MAPRALSVNLSMTLDGVVQAPGRANEDARDGFTHGGWALPYFDPVMASSAAEGMAKESALLFGRRTYEDFHSVWPKRTNNPFTEVLNKSLKYVVSTTMKGPLPWENSQLLSGDAAAVVSRLKASPGPDLVVLGSGALVQALLRAGLVDELHLSIHPLILGSGRRLFPESGSRLALRLTESKTTTTGVVLATYKPASVG